jgi:hypothetical protein
MTVTSSTMMGQNGAGDAMTAPPPLCNDDDDNGQGGCLFGRAMFPNAKGRGGDCNNDKTLSQPTHSWRGMSGRQWWRVGGAMAFSQCWHWHTGV